MDPSVPPAIHAQRHMPLSLHDDTKDELDDMESRGIITKLKEGLGEQSGVQQEAE